MDADAAAVEIQHADASRREHRLLRSGAARSNGTNVASTAADVHPPVAVPTSRAEASPLAFPTVLRPQFLKLLPVVSTVICSMLTLPMLGGSDQERTTSDREAAEKSGRPARFVLGRSGRDERPVPVPKSLRGLRAPLPLGVHSRPRCG